MDNTERRRNLEEAGRWLRTQRTKRGYDTAGKLARALGVDPSRISNYERGMSAVPDERAAQIADLFGMDEIEVRRGLGLWVPDDAKESQEPSGEGKYWNLLERLEAIKDEINRLQDETREQEEQDRRRRSA